MVNSAQAFLSHLIDYAGMFPPARLPLEEALRQYLQQRRSSPHAWMLGRFVCPAAQLGDIVRWVRAPEDAALLSITALGQQAPHAEGLLPQLETDLRAIHDFRRAWGHDAVVDTLELALPKDASVEHLVEAIPAVRARLEAANLRGFLEMPLHASWRVGVARLSEESADTAGRIGLKLRCGGITADAFPSDEDVAYFLIRCRNAKVPWKATAGLHHPRRFWDASLHLWHHGFLNVFGAGLLAFSNPLSEADVTAILVDRDGQHFRFDAEGLAWQRWTCSLARIIEIRSHWVSSFGSCSFEEPCQDLRALGLIE